MTTTSTRQVIVGHTVILEIDVRDARGNRIDADAQPQVSIIDSSGAVQRAMSSTDVVRIQEGRYRYAYAVPATARTGISINRIRRSALAKAGLLSLSLRMTLF